MPQRFLALKNLAVLALLGAATLVASQHKSLRAAWAVGGLDHGERAARDAARHRLSLLGEPGLVALEAWLDAADAKDERRGLIELEEWLLDPPADMAWDRLSLARVLTRRAGLEDVWPSCGRFDNTSIRALKSLGRDAHIAIAERLSLLVETDRPLSPRELITLLAVLEEPRSDAEDRLAPPLWELWRRGSKLRFKSETLWRGGGVEIAVADTVRESLERIACRYQGLDIWEARDREDAARAALTRLGASLEWARQRGLELSDLSPTKLEQRLREEALWRPELPDELWDLGPVLADAKGYRLSLEVGEGGASWRCIARREARGARFDFVLTHKKILAAYLDLAERIEAGLPAGSWSSEPLLPWAFDRVLTHFCSGEPSPKHPRCRAQERLDFGSGPLLFHGELRAAETLRAFLAPADATEAFEPPSLVDPARGWHAGYRFELGPVDERGGRTWARAWPLRPGESGRFVFEIRSAEALRFLEAPPTRGTSTSAELRFVHDGN